MRKEIFLFIIFEICSNAIYSQIQIDRIPYTERNNIDFDNIPTITLPELDFTAIKDEDIIDERNGLVLGYYIL